MTPTRPGVQKVDFTAEQAISIEARLTALETKATLAQWFLGIILVTLGGSAVKYWFF